MSYNTIAQSRYKNVREITHVRITTYHKIINFLYIDQGDKMRILSTNLSKVGN